jgi:MoaA/NifB/PqqE/SkfB family radical SAM enzyme
MKRVVFKITDRQNSKFFSYPQKKEIKKQTTDISLESIKKIIVEDYKQLFDEAELTGSGVFLHPELEKIVDFLEKTTKFVWLEAGEEDLKKYQKIIQKEKVGLKFYLAGLKPEENDILMGSGAFKRIEKNIDFALKEGKQVSIDFLIHQKNWKTLPSVIDFSNQKKLSLNFQELMPLGDATKKEKLILSGEDLRSFWKALVNWKLKGFRFSAFSNFLSNHGNCRFEKIIVFNELGCLEKCPLDSFFTSVEKKNSLQNTKCASCFCWDKKLDFSDSSLTKGKNKKETTLAMVAKAYYQRELFPEVNIDKALKINQKEDPKTIAEIAESFNLVRRMDGVSWDWFSNYQKQEEELNLIITNQSNLDYHFYPKPFKKETISFPEVGSFLEEANFKGISRVILSGGDILLFPQIKELFQFLGKVNLQAVFSLDGWNFEKYQEEIIKIPNASFGFEVYGATASVHDKHVGKEGAFDKIMEAMEFLIDKEKPVGLNYILTQKNLKELESMINFASMLELSFFNLTPVEDKFTKISKAYANSSKNIADAEKHLKESLTKKGVKLRCSLTRFPRTN